MAGTEFGQDVGIGAAFLELFAIAGCTDSFAVVEVARANLLSWRICFGTFGPGWIWTGSSMRTGCIAGKVKTMVGGAIGEAFGKVGIFPCRGRRTVSTSVTQAHMPFADHASLVVSGLEEGSECGAVRLDERISLGTEKNKVFEAASESVPTGKESIASGCTTGRWSVSIREENPKPGQAFHLGSVNLVLVGITGEVLVGRGVAHAHVVGHEKDDVGVGFGKKESWEKEEEWGSHGCLKKVAQASSLRFGGNRISQAGSMRHGGSSTVL